MFIRKVDQTIICGCFTAFLFDSEPMYNPSFIPSSSPGRLLHNCLLHCEATVYVFPTQETVSNLFEERKWAVKFDYNKFHEDSYASRLFLQHLVQDNNKENINALYYLPFVRGTTSNR